MLRKTNNAWFWKNIISISINTLIAECSRGLYIATLWHMVLHCEGDKFLNGLLVSLFSFGRLFALLGMGYLSDIISERKIIICSNLILILSSATYIAVYSFPNQWVLMACRFVCGFGTGSVSVARSHTAKITTAEERTAFISLNSLSSYAGVAFGPLLGLAISTIFDEFEPHNVTEDGTPVYNDDDLSIFNSITLPAYLLIFLNCISVSLFLFIFKEVPVEMLNGVESKPLLSEEKQISTQSSVTSENLPIIKNEDFDSSNIEVSAGNVQVENENKYHQTGELSENTILIGILIYIFLNFAGRSVISLVETLGTPAYLEIKHATGPDGTSESSLLFGYMGIAGLFVFGITMLGKISDVYFVLLAYCLTAIACLTLYFSYHTLTGLLVGLILIWTFAFPMLSTCVLASFSKIIGKKPVGGMMGWIGFSGSVGRVIMPFLTGVIKAEIVFLINAGICCFSIGLIIFYQLYVSNKKKLLTQAPDFQKT